MKLGEVFISEFFQGPTGRGQGGWTASRFARFLSGPQTIALKAPIPLNQTLDVNLMDSGAELLEAKTGQIIMQARPWTPNFPRTTSIPIPEAVLAKEGFLFRDKKHPVPNCFSCGLEEHAMGVHPGPLYDGRVAVDWSVPKWAVSKDGKIDDGCLWAALDCASGFYVASDGGVRLSFTAQYAVNIIQPLQEDETYALIAWEGEGPAHWEGRKRNAAAVAFDSKGELVGQAVSFWIAAKEQD